KTRSSDRHVHLVRCVVRGRPVQRSAGRRPRAVLGTTDQGMAEARPEVVPVTVEERRAGGDEETRTPDPLLAKEMLFQLSYVPGELRDSVGSLWDEDGGRFWTRTRDLCLIRAVL